MLSKKIFLDTNFLIDTIKFKVELERIKEFFNEPTDFYILSSCFEELKKIAESKGRAGNCAKIAVQLIKTKNINVLETRESPDKAFLNIADKNTIIATNDSMLRKKLKERGIKTIYLRGRKKLEVG
ncbi:MAG: PIN domain-containing protein [Candidatus Aenigmatarchaeota archaeon]